MDEGDRAGTVCSPCAARSDTHQRPPSLCLVFVMVVVLTQRITADCDRLPVVSHGGIEYTNGSSQALAAMIWCEEGYNLVGSDVRTCSLNGTWNGTQPSCELVTCESLPTIPNGQVQHADTTVTIGSVAKYKCIKGFRLVGVANRTCRFDASWTGEQPECVRIVCKHPGAPLHGHATPEDVTDYPAGTTIHYSCSSGYTLHGPATIECSQQGRWTAVLPNCTVIDCGTPPVLPHATAYYTKTVMDQSVTYSCSPGYEATSPTVLNCSADGSWRGNIMHCIRVPLDSTESKYSTPQTTAPDLAGTSSSIQSTSHVKSTLDISSTLGISSLPSSAHTQISQTSGATTVTEESSPLITTTVDLTTLPETTTYLATTYSSTTGLPSTESTLESEAETTTATYSTTSATTSSRPTTFTMSSTTTPTTTTTTAASTVTVTTGDVQTSTVGSSTYQTEGSGLDLATTDNTWDTTTVASLHRTLNASGILTKGVLAGIASSVALTLICLTTVGCFVKKRRCRGQYAVTTEDAIRTRHRETDTNRKRHLQGNGHVVGVGNGHDNHVTNWYEGGTSSKRRDESSPHNHDVMRDQNKNKETPLQMNFSAGRCALAQPQIDGGNVYISDPRREYLKPSYSNRTAL